MSFKEVSRFENFFWPSVILLFGLGLTLAKPMIRGVAKRCFAVVMYFFTIFYNKMMSSRKKELFSSIEQHLKDVPGEILEIGAGTGANFAFYPRGCSIVALDPNPHMNYFLLHTKKYYPHVILKNYIVGSAEDMKGIEDNSMSAAVCTLVLCSVDSVEQVLKEIVRVLKPVSCVIVFAKGLQKSRYHSVNLGKKKLRDNKLCFFAKVPQFYLGYFHLPIVPLLGYVGKFLPHGRFWGDSQALKLVPQSINNGPLGSC